MPIWPRFGLQDFFLRVLDVRHYRKLPSYSISRKALITQTEENSKKRHFDLN